VSTLYFRGSPPENPFEDLIFLRPLENPLKKALLYLVIAAGTVLGASAIYYCGCALGQAKSHLVGGLLFVYFATYLLVQVYFVWYLYCRFAKRTQTNAPPGLTVDVFMPAFNEPLWIVKKAVKAAREITYPHRTFLLDDSPTKRYIHLAEQLGVEYLTRNGNKDFKAGNVNTALEKTSGDFIAIFDIDHVPRPDFLNRTLGHFQDPQVGFVQAMQTFSNQGDGIIAKAAVETSCEYFNISACCKDAVGAMGHHGSNAVIRRSALESIGGYRPGLTEDLETSICLHASGWKSAYVCEPLAPGLAPADFSAFCKQQLKWSRGVFETALRSIFTGLFFKLTWHQRLAYSVRSSYYLIGVSMFLGMATTAFYLFTPSAKIYEGFMARCLPFTIVSMAIRYLMLRTRGTDPTALKGVHFHGTSLVLCTWPIYLLSAICTLVRIPIPFISTPKKANSSRISPWIIAPQLTMVALLAAGLLYKTIHWAAEPAPLTVTAALLLIFQQWILIVPVSQVLTNKFKKPRPRALTGRQRQVKAPCQPNQELEKAA
jgi:cellulose synthase/poly-beta-1,6-N-acetylglucosamine synthase-like glycosyltransferase